MGKYSGNFDVKKSTNASIVSWAVFLSLYTNFESLLIEYPTPAGLSINKRFVKLSHEYGFATKSWSAWYDAPIGKIYGAIYCNNPILDAQPGPPFIHTVTGRVFFAPL